ncbi:hypothetical protein [Candidatus Nitrososphaera sp. FF02]
MADSVMSYAIAAGVFAFLTGVLFGARAQRYRAGFAETKSSTTRDTVA